MTGNTRPPAPEATVAPPGAGGPAAQDAAVQSNRQRLAGRWRSWRWPLLVATVVVAVVLLAALLARVPTRGDLDVDSTHPHGSRAVGQILRDQGVSVKQVTTVGSEASTGPDTTLAVVHPQLLGPTELDRLAATSADLVLVEPDLPTLAALAPFARVAGTVKATDLAPGCSDPDAVAAGTAAAGGHLYRAIGTTAELCYPQSTEPDAGTGSMVRGRQGGRTVTVLGQADVLRNGDLARQGNAALALRVLGVHDRLVWLRPDPLAPQRDTPPTLGELLPDWVHWVGVQLFVVLGVVMIWRARRLGRLVTEPLPVVVRAAETQEGRARLYRQARARGRAAATLRTAALRRLAARLDVPPETTPDGLAAIVTELTGRPGPQVRQTLLGPAPVDDATLVRLAGDLDALEQAVVRRDVSGATAPATGSAPERSAPGRKVEDR